MNIFYGPIEYLTAFALVLVAGVLCGFGLGWHFCGHFKTRTARASQQGRTAPA